MMFTVHSSRAHVAEHQLIVNQLSLQRSELSLEFLDGCLLCTRQQKYLFYLMQFFFEPGSYGASRVGDILG